MGGIQQTPRFGLMRSVEKFEEESAFFGCRATERNKKGPLTHHESAGLRYGVAARQFVIGITLTNT
jgi:hypothetical protein